MGKLIIPYIMPPWPFSSLKIYIQEPHSGLVSEFGLHFVKNGTIEDVYAKILVKAETKRIMADYDVDYRPSLKEAESIIEDAQKFLERIKEAISQLK